MFETKVVTRIRTDKCYAHDVADAVVGANVVLDVTEGLENGCAIVDDACDERKGAIYVVGW